MSREIGTDMDNKIQDVKEWVHRRKIYGIYSRLRIPKYIRKIEHIDVLNRFLSSCLTNKWITEKSAQKCREEWLVMKCKKETVK